MSLPTNFFIGRGGKEPYEIYYPETIDVSNATIQSSINHTSYGALNSALGNPYGLFVTPSHKVHIGVANGSGAVKEAYEILNPPSFSSGVSVGITDSFSRGLSSYTSMTHKFVDGGTKYLSMDYAGSIQMHTVSGSPYILSNVTNSASSTFTHSNNGGLGSAYGCDISPDGRWLIVAGRSQGASVIIYELTTFWDLSSAFLHAEINTSALGSANIRPTGVNWNADATQFMIVDGDYSSNEQWLRVYSITSPFSGFAGLNQINNINLSSTCNRIVEACFSPDRPDIMYLLDNSNETVYQLSL